MTEGSSPSRRAPIDVVLARPELLLYAAAVLCIAGFELYRTPGNPPGFHRDEAWESYNAYTISRSAHDQNGAFMPLNFPSFGDYKSPAFVYLLAAVFRMTGPSAAVARELGAAVVLAGILLLGLLAYRLTRSAAVAAGVIVLGGLTPWLYELGRAAWETTLLPLAITCVLLAVQWSSRSTRALPVRAAVVGAAFSLLIYCYVEGRLLAVLYAAALLAFVGTARRRWLLACWAGIAVAFLPLAYLAVAHRGGLTARWGQTTFIHRDTAPWVAAGDAAWNYLRDVSLWHWVVSGDKKPHIHTWGAGQLYGSVVVLAAVGAWTVLRRRPLDRWWLFALIAALVSPIPAALTDDRHHALRLLPIPVFMLVFAAPGLQAAARLVRGRGGRVWAARAAAVVLLGGVVTQFVWFEHWYRIRGPARTEFFEAGVPDLLQKAFLDGNGVVYVDHDDVAAQTHALWYAVSHGASSASAVILPDGGIPPTGAMVFGRTQACDYVCKTIADADTYWIATAEGPKP